MNNKRLFSIILVVFIDLLGFSLILPLLPIYAETFKANQTVTGILIASYALMQLIGAPDSGAVSPTASDAAALSCRLASSAPS